MLLRDFNLRALNSATKYPSIPTYHVMGDRGRLQEEILSRIEGGAREDAAAVDSLPEEYVDQLRALGYVD